MPQSPAIVWAQGDLIDYTPGADVAAGDVVVLGSRIVAVAPIAIASGVLGALKLKGVVKMPKKTGAIAVGAPVYWNPTGDPNTGTADTGAAEATPTETNYPAGPAVLAAGSSDDYVYVSLTPGYLDRGTVNSSVAATGSAQGDAAQVYEGVTVVTASDGTKGVILPTAVAGMRVTLKNSVAAILKVYPATGGAINALSANAAISLAASVPATFVATSATQWYTLPLLPS